MADDPQVLDLLLVGGRLLGPQGGEATVADLGIRDGVVAEIAARIDPARSHRSIDVRGLLVTPGLIDLHVHAYPGATYWGIDMDAPSLAHGVTTIVDAGSAGAYTFDGLAAKLRSYTVTARAFLNIAGSGLAGPYGELLVPELADVEAAVRTARRHADLIVGFKLRASPNTVGSHAEEALRAVRRAADETGLPIMVHVSESPPNLELVLDHLHEGDVLTHCFTPYDNCIVDEQGGVRPDVRRALDRGVRLDVGHGSGSFSFPAAEAYAGAGLPTPIVSTDLHRRSVLGPAFNMSVVMTKMVAAGFSVEDTVRATTQTPAAVLGSAPSLRVGAPADVAVLDVVDRDQVLWDSRGVERTGRKRIACRLTVSDGGLEHVDPLLRVRTPTSG